jgi:hypothetical protein
MLRRLVTRPRLIPVLLCLHIVPLLLFPASAYSLKVQEWWLPVLLAFLTVLALVQLLLRRSVAPWPWYMLSFSQGFNIISRLMMLMPHASLYVEGVQRFNAAYVILSVAAVVLSAAALWHCELPEVRGSIHSRPQPQKAA